MDGIMTISMTRAGGEACAETPNASRDDGNARRIVGMELKGLRRGERHQYA